MSVIDIGFALAFMNKTVYFNKIFLVTVSGLMTSQRTKYYEKALNYNKQVVFFTFSGLFEACLICKKERKRETQFKDERILTR